MLLNPKLQTRHGVADSHIFRIEIGLGDPLADVFEAWEAVVPLILVTALCPRSPFVSKASQP